MFGSWCAHVLYSAPAGRQITIIVLPFSFEGVDVPSTTATIFEKPIKQNRFLTYFGGAGVVPIDSSRKIRPGHGVKIGF